MMLKPLMVALALAVVTTVGVQADDTDGKKKNQKPQPTAEQKALHAEMLGKYDADKNGKLSGAERKAMSKEDRKKLRDARGPKNERKEKREKKNKDK